MTAPRFLWPVYAFDRNGYRMLASFFDYGDAVSFANAGGDGPYRYIGEPRHDRRESGYLVEIEHGVDPETGNPRVAA